jgi:hypothetical protein
MINPPKWILAVFWTAAAYDGLLGVLFLIRPGWAFRVFEVTPPNHMGYVQFPAALLIIFGIMFAARQSRLDRLRCPAEGRLLRRDFFLLDYERAAGNVEAVRLDRLGHGGPVRSGVLGALPARQG